MELARDRTHRARTSKDLTLSPTEEFEAIFLKHWPRIYAHLRRLLGDPAEAEDLALETFWKLYHRPPHLAEKVQVGGWLYRVATNLGLNAIRTEKRRGRYEIEAGLWDPTQDPDRGDPAKWAAHAEQVRRVREILCDLSPRQARLLILRHSGLTYKELAAALEVSPESIGKLLTRAEAEFERLWDKSAGG